MCIRKMIDDIVLIINKTYNKMANELEQTVLSKAQQWLDGAYDDATKEQIKYLMDNVIKELT